MQTNTYLQFFMGEESIKAQSRYPIVGYYGVVNILYTNIMYCKRRAIERTMTH